MFAAYCCYSSGSHIWSFETTVSSVGHFYKETFISSMCVQSIAFVNALSHVRYSLLCTTTALLVLGGPSFSDVEKETPEKRKLYSVFWQQDLG